MTSSLPALIEHLMDRVDVTDVLVNNGTEVWVESNGRLFPAGHLESGAIDASLERLLAPLGRRLDRLCPTVDARLTDGTRVCAVIPPIAADGTTVSFRVLRHRHCTIDDFSDDPVIRTKVRTIVSAKSNVLVSGATGAGKTTLIGALIDTIRHSERIIVLEDTRELIVSHPHCVRLEARPATADGLGEVTLDDLLRAALRLRPDRLVLGEIRDREAATLVNALNTGHAGSLASVHANSATDALTRVELLLSRLMPGVVSSSIGAMVRTAIDTVIHVERTPDGERRITSVESTR